MTIPPSTFWKDQLLSNKALDLSNASWQKSRIQLVLRSLFIASFEEISKYRGIAFLSLHTSESHVQLFHHSVIIGRSWSSPSKQYVSVRGFNKSAKPVQIVQRSAKNVKQWSFLDQEFMPDLESIDKFENSKNPKVECHYKNIIHIPN